MTIFSAIGLLAALASADVSGFDLFADGGRVHLLTGRAAGGAPALEYSRLEKDGWSAPAAVAGSLAPYRAEQGDIQLAADGERLFAVWTATGAGPMKSGPLAAAASDDGGRTWRPAAAPSGRDAAGRRFADLAASARGWQAVWLDRAGAASLRHASFDGRRWTRERELDPSTCECCWNTLAASGRRLFALYRDAAPRDLSLAWSADGKTWSRAGSVGGFGWRFRGCPHVGGGLAVAGDALHAVVWNGDDRAPGVYYARASAPYRAWAGPVRLGGTESKYADVAAAGARVAAVWSEELAVYCAVSEDGGRTWPAPRRLSAPGVPASRPRVVSAKGSFTAVWLEKDGEDRRLGWTRF